MKVPILAIALAGLAALVVGRSLLRAQETPPPAQTAATPSPTGQASARSVWDGVYTEAQAKRGEDVYRASCTACHGESLEGGGPVSALTGAVFSGNWNGLTMGDLFERVRISMPLDKPGTLSRQQYADALAFVLSANKFPAGATELSRQTEMLNLIKFLAAKP